MQPAKQPSSELGPGAYSIDLHHLLPALQEGVLVLAREGRLLWANDRAAAILGRPTSELLRSELDLHFLRRDGSVVTREELPGWRALQTGEPQAEIELGLTSPAGDVRWMLVGARPAADQSRAVMTLNDITSIVTRENQLARAQVLQKATLEYAGHAIIVCDTEGTIQMFNPAAERLLGYGAEELVGRETPGVFHDVDEVAARANELGVPPGFEAFIHNTRIGGAETREWTYVRRDGTLIPVSLTVTALRDGQGDIFGFVGIAEDISARKAMEGRLLAELEQRTRMEARMRELIGALPDLVFCVDHRGVFRYVHTPDEGLLYVPASAILGRRLQELMPPQLVAAVEERIAALCADEVATPFIYDLHTPRGLRSFEARVAHSGEDEVAIVARDVTEARALEKMKDEFVSTVSHELRTPLTSIRGSLSLLSSGVVEAGSKEHGELVAIALRNAERLGRLINDILDFDRAHANLTVTLQSQPLAPIVRQALLDTEPLARQFEVSFKLLACDEQAWARVDADRLSQVLYNLLSNAAKYGDASCPIEISLRGHDQAWRVQVTNGGPAIPESFRSRIFQRFAMVDASDHRERSGTGLGLAISRALIERMGGTIDYVSSPERTAFFFDLPRVQPAASQLAR